MQSEKVKQNSAATAKRLKAAAAAKVSLTRHEELVKELQLNREASIQTIAALAKFLKGNIGKTEVTNQLKEIGTPDAKKVVKAIEALNKTVQKKETDFKPVLEILGKMEKHLAEVPKELPEAPEAAEVDFTGTNERLDKIEAAIADLDLHVEAPVVKVAATKVEAPDFTPMQEPLLDLLGAVRDIVIPPAEVTDLSTVEELLTKANELLEKIEKKKPAGGGGGGGGGMVPYKDPVTGYSVQVATETDGSIPTTEKNSKATAKYSIAAISETATNKYFFFEDKDLNWYIMRKNLTTLVFSYAKGTGGYTSVYVDATSAPSPAPTYGTYGATF